MPNFTIMSYTVALLLHSLHDASCLSVVSFSSTIPQVLFLKIIISYFGFGFTSTYNSILFCCLRRNVEPCCHTHNSRTTMNVYSASRLVV